MIPTQVAMPAIHPELAGVVHAFAAAGVRWLLLRTPDGGLSAPRGDIDLLVDPDDSRLVARLLSDRGFAKLPRRGADLHFLNYLAESNQWLWIHVTSRLAFGREQLPLRGDHGCLTCRLVEHLLPQPDPDTAFWLLLWHCLGEKGHVAPHHRPALRGGAVAADCSGPFALAFARAAGDAVLPETLLDAVIHDNWNAVDIAIPICTRARDKARSSSVLARARRAIVTTVGALTHWRQRRGVSVALIGPDGAGKTTLATGICGSVPFRSRVIYMGLTGGALRRIRRARLPGLVFIASACVLWARYLRAWFHMLRGRLVVFDRYVYDAVAPPGYTPGPFERVGRRLSRRICPSPDLVLLLDAPGAVMYARKGEYNPETLEHWRSDFRSLETQLKRLHRLDAGVSAADVQREAVARTWRIYSQRWTALSSRESRRSS
jgi:thymidylate kinase